MRDLREFIAKLRNENELVSINEEVDPHLEVAEIHRRVVSEKGKALLFNKVKGSPFRIATNLFGSEKRIELAFPSKPEVFIKNMVSLLQEEMPPSMQSLWKRRQDFARFFRLGTKKQKYAPVAECEISPPDLNQVPLLKCWPEDGGHFITLPLVYTENPHGGAPNLGMYRIQRFDNKTTGLHMQIGKGGGFHYHAAEQMHTPLPVSIFVGGPPALILAAIAPLPENVPEILFTSLLMNEKLDISKHSGHPHPIISHCEFALLGHAKPKERRIEGPFGDHYGYYSLAHEFPVFHCETLLHRKDAIYPATVVGKPPQEDLYIGDYLQTLLSPLFPIVMPAVKNLHTFGESGFHPLAAAQVKERYEKECLSCAFRILGEGQLSLTKFLILTDQNINIRNIKELLETVLARFRPEKDFYIFSNTSHDTLDYTGSSLNKGSKAVLIGVGTPQRQLLDEFRRSLPPHIKKVRVFCKGCLVVECAAFKELKDVSFIAQHEDFAVWPLIIVVDSADQTCSSDLEFLWTVFTRFDPVQDIYARAQTMQRHKISYSFPIVIDARMKPHYPKELEPDETTKKLVDRRWNMYFSKSNN